MAIELASPPMSIRPRAAHFPSLLGRGLGCALGLVRHDHIMRLRRRHVPFRRLTSSGIEDQPASRITACVTHLALVRPFPDLLGWGLGAEGSSCDMDNMIARLKSRRTPSGSRSPQSPKGGWVGCMDPTVPSFLLNGGRYTSIRNGYTTSLTAEGEDATASDLSEARGRIAGHASAVLTFPKTCWVRGMDVILMLLDVKSELGDESEMASELKLAQHYGSWTEG